MNRRGGGEPPSGKRESGKDLAHLVIHHRGRKGIKDAALADQCGFTVVEQMYQRLGHKLLLLPRSSWFELKPEKRNSRQGRARPVIVFRQNAVIMISAWLGTDRAREARTSIVPLLRTRRRASKNKQRRPRRADDPPRQANYQEALARLQIAMGRLWKLLPSKNKPARQ